ncbi:MAG TPA: heparinase II/III family protein [Alphaproteobacteria bacterium]|nr:heparinase II/III family protein [Alphaproteobacteria bacterium]
MAADNATTSSKNAADKSGESNRLALLSAELQRPLGQQARRFFGRVETLVFAAPGYAATLFGRVPASLRLLPPDPWPGDADHGRAILDGKFTFFGRAVPVFSPDSSDTHVVWSPSGTDAEWREQLHGFSWLKDLRVVGGEAPRQRARQLVASWIAQEGRRWNRLSWRADILSTRICAWLSAADMLESDDPVFAQRLRDSLARQTRQLARALPGELVGARLIAAAKGLIYAGACLAQGAAQQDRLLARAGALISREMARAVLGDGGNSERSPRLQLAMLRDLIDMRAVLLAAKLEVPDAVQIGIDRMAPMLRFFRHGDGALSLFNDSVESEAWLIDLALAQADAKGKPLASAPHSGFERATANRTLLLMDVGAPPPPGYEAHAFAGTLAFEMSVGKERLIVNGGAAANPQRAWRMAMASSAAHSTGTLGDMNIAEIFDLPGSDARPPARLIGRRPERVACRRDEADGAIWIEGHHDGYLKPYGLVHRRRLYLSPGGDDLRGEDSFLPAEALKHADGPTHDNAPFSAASVKRAAVGLPFSLRFHLHPAVRTSLVQDGSAILLRLPGSGWRFRAAGASTLTLEESVYMGARGEPRRNEQIVVSGHLAPEGMTVKWALRRVSDK